MSNEPQPTIDVYGADWCGDCTQAKNTLHRLGVPYVWHNIEQEEGAAQKAVPISGQQHIPVVHFGDGSFLVEPSANDLKNKLDSSFEAKRPMPNSKAHSAAAAQHSPGSQPTA